MGEKVVKGLEIKGGISVNRFSRKESLGVFRGYGVNWGLVII